jgi:hypothetical protein
MKYFVFGFCLLYAFVNCMISIWEHNSYLVSVWAADIVAWLSAVFAHLGLDQERKSK